MNKPIVSPHIRLRHPEFFTIGEKSIIDDFCYLSTKLILGFNIHIGASCSVIGGPESSLIMKDYTAIATGTRVVCGTADFVNDLAVVLDEFDNVVNEGRGLSGDVILERFSIVGANSVVLPNNHIKEGVAIGASSLVPVNFNFEPWCVYVGQPIRKVKERNKESILEQVRKLGYI